MPQAERRHEAHGSQRTRAPLRTYNSRLGANCTVSAMDGALPSGERPYDRREPTMSRLSPHTHSGARRTESTTDAPPLKGRRLRPSATYSKFGSHGSRETPQPRSLPAARGQCLGGHHVHTASRRTISSGPVAVRLPLMRCPAGRRLRSSAINSSLRAKIMADTDDTALLAARGYEASEHQRDGASCRIIQFWGQGNGAHQHVSAPAGRHLRASATYRTERL